MNDIGIILLLLGIGAVLLMAELFLPTHGVLGVAGLLAVLGGIGYTFRLNQWAGVGLAIACAASTPLLWTLAVKYWPQTPLGRRIVLGPVVNVPEPPPVHIGQTGITISGLRPMGVCEFNGQRVEAITEIGTLEPQTSVVVTAITDRRPTVRAVTSSERTS
jgi:membrane-bound serine protease (ClpP class)